MLDGNNNALAEAVQLTATYIEGLEVRNYGVNAGGGCDAFSNYPGGHRPEP